MRESKLWLLHLLAGAIIFFLLGLHMFIMHLDSILAWLGIGYREPIDAASVFARSRQAFFMVTYIILLGAALYHGLYGLKNIINEMNLSHVIEKVIAGVLTVGGLLLFAYGAYAAIFIFVK